MDFICGGHGNVTSVEDWFRPESDCHVDIINIFASSCVVYGSIIILCYLRFSRLYRSVLRTKLLPGDTLRGLLTLLLLLVHVAEVGDAVLGYLAGPREAVYVVITPAVSLAAWITAVVLQNLQETQRRHNYLAVTAVLWLGCGSARVLRVSQLLTRGLDATHVRLHTAASTATLFFLLGVTDVYTFHRQTCCRHGKKEPKDKAGDERLMSNDISYHHSLANFYSKATFYWLTSFLRVGYAAPLELTDLGGLPEEEKTCKQFDKFHDVYLKEKCAANKEGRGVSLWRCYFRNCWPLFCLGGFLKLLGDFVGFVGPLGISVIMEYVARLQNSTDTVGHRHTQLVYPTIQEMLSNGYVMGVIVFVSALAQGTFSQNSTHLVNVEGIHLKGALQALVYNKALRLCVWSISDHKDEASPDSEAASEVDDMELNATDSSQGKVVVDIGTITNLMSEDPFNVMSFIWIGHYIWAIPLKIGVLMYLLYLKLGWSAILGAAFCILTMTPLQFLIGKRMSSNSKAVTEISDERLRKMNEVLQGIKLLKLYGWECIYGNRISETRKKELKLLDKDSLYWALMTFLTHASSVLITLVTFGVYFAVEGTVHSAGNVFAGLALFNQLTVPLFIFPITVPIIISAMVSTKRLEEFLALPETSSSIVCSNEETLPRNDEVREETIHAEKYRLLEITNNGLKPSTKRQETLQNVRLGRPDSVFVLGNIQEGEEEPEEEKTDVPRSDTEDIAVSVTNSSHSWTGDADKPLLNLNSVTLPKGKLTIIVGRVGSGKTSLLSALLGEMHTLSGKVQWASGTTVAYAAQKPWLLNGTLRDNILFGQPFRPRRFGRVIAACALQPDIDILPGKDLTEIGEKGINLSGGQKQRIAIARALYSTANFVVLDDPLSALDYQVGQQVFDEGIKRLLLKQRRTVVLVTHRLQLLSHAHWIIALDRGSVRAQGSLADIESSDLELVKTWRAMMSRQALEEQKNARGRTAKERWQLVKLVSRIGVQLRQRNVTDGTWQTEEEAHVAPPRFMPLRKRLGTFSGSRYFAHDLPLPIDECEAEFVEGAKRGRGSIKRSRTSTSTTTEPLSQQHKVVLRATSLQAPRVNDNAPFPVIRQYSSPSMQHDQLGPTACSKTRTCTLQNNPSQGSLLKRILALQSQKTMNATPEISCGVMNDKNKLKKLISSTSTVPAMEDAHKPVKRLLSSASGFSEDTNDEEEAYDDVVDVRNGRLIYEEDREYGKISKKIYMGYLCACGVTVGIAYLVSAVAWQGLRVYTDYWLSRWTEKGNATLTQQHADDPGEMMEYFLVYAALSVTSILLSLSSNGIGQYAGAQARRTLHDKMLHHILRCPLRFFESTPVGRIINRFSTDMSVIDKKIATSIQRLLQFLLLCFSAILLNAIITPWFLVVAVPICAVYYLVQRFYRCSSRELQRLDSITRSPIFSHFSETLGGLTTIRAFGHQQMFTELLLEKMDTHNNAFLIMNTSNRWLGIALDYLGGVIVFVAIVAALVSASLLPGMVTPALVGLAVNYTLLVPIYLNWVVKFLADMEMYMSAVERVHLYALMPTEDYRLQGVQVPRSWPQQGDIVFQDVSLRYDASRDPVVTNLNLHIPSGQKVGICGRTGSGKSSLVMSLFHMVEVFEGNILIDGVDINQVPLQVLRSRLSIIPQDVLMFSGTIRENLDPKSQYSDAELWNSLELAQLKEIVSSYPGGLDGEVREGGENVSAGERQLFCLARAILHGAACLVMDEATSSVDPTTEKALLAAATRAFAGRTVITIAHRVSTILDYDRILVLDAGQIVEDGTPSQLLHRSMGIFTSMLRASEEGTLTA